MGLKTIGKAGKAVTKHLGKTLTSLGESPDKRGQQRFNVAKNSREIVSNQWHNKNVKIKGKSDLGLNTGML